MKEAIQKAIEGGWEGLEWYESIKIDSFRSVDIHSRVWGESKDGEVHLTTVAQILLDPLFWQALGKSLGWEWHYRVVWHRFIDHLAEGKNPEDFFKSLLTP